MKDKKEKSIAPKKEAIVKKALIFGENMRAIRKQRGFTTEAFATFMNISTAYVGLIERGERTPSLETFLRICEFFGEDPTAMLKENSAGLAVRETKLAAKNISADKIKNRHKMVNSMLDTFDPVELDHAVAMIKNFKNYVEMRKNDEAKK